jgi:hypothetical protein
MKGNLQGAGHRQCAQQNYRDCRLMHEAEDGPRLWHVATFDLRLAEPQILRRSLTLGETD